MILEPTLPLGVDGFARLYEGEGSVVAHRKPSKLSYQLRLQVQMKDEDVMKAVYSEFGGSLCRFRAHTGYVGWSWCLHGIPAGNLIMAMLPYLFSRRREQLQRALLLWGEADYKYKWDPELKTFRRSCEGKAA